MPSTSGTRSTSNQGGLEGFSEADVIAKSRHDVPQTNHKSEYRWEMEEDVGWFDPVRRPMEEFTIPMLTLDVCRDDFEECGEWKEDDMCETEPDSMKLYCQQTCELCEDYIVTWPNRVG